MSPGGRDTLFEAPVPDGRAGHNGSNGHAAGEGRRALFSAPPRRTGTVVVECSRCDAHTPVPVLQLPVRMLPSLFVPFRSYPLLMCCPAGRHLAWCRLDLSSLLP